MSIPNQGLGEQLPGIVLDFIQLTKNAGDPQGFVVANAVPVASTGVVYLNSFLLPRNVTFAWECHFTSNGTIAAKIELEQGFQRPTAEGQADAAWVVPDNKSTPIFTVADSNYHITSYAPDPTPFARLKITGTGSNDASTILAAIKAYIIKNSLA